MRVRKSPEELLSRTVTTVSMTRGHETGTKFLKRPIQRVLRFRGINRETDTDCPVYSRHGRQHIT